MEKIEYNGDTFYYAKGKLYDSSFIEVPSNVSYPILTKRFENIDCTNYGEDEFLELLREVKNAGAYQKCIDLILDVGFVRFQKSKSFLSVMFPMVTSCYRSMHKPEKAIEFWQENKDKYAMASVSFLTSLAAAYCDIEDYDQAKHFADQAYSLQGGYQGYMTELSLVYERIRKETETLKK